MTQPDENPRDDSGKAVPGKPDVPLDEDAAWRAIVENYGERPSLGTREEPDPAVERAGEPTDRDVFDRSYLDSLDDRRRETAHVVDSWADEGHFVPPEPPPLPALTPARRFAWLGLFGAPVLMLLAVVFGWTYPAWVALLLVAGFVGGFVFLVATMPRNRGDWPGDDGAVV